MKFKILLFVPLLLLGCKKKDSSNPSPLPSTANVEGVWTGSMGSPVTTTQALVLTLSQTGTSLTGTFNIENGSATGTISGSVRGDIVTFTATQTTPCAGSYTGDADVDGDEMEGPLKGTSICSGAFDGVFFVSR